MNESEARRAALTAAITWCSPAGESMSTDAMLGYAEQFEEWLTRPAQLIPKETPADVGPGPVKTTRPNPYCTACEHAPHGAGACSVACSCPGYATCTCVDHWHAPGDWGRERDLPCAHDACTCPTSRHAPTRARTAGDVADPAGCACTFQTVYLACPSCGHDRHEPGECACTSTYTGVAPEQRIPHDPYMDGPDVPQRRAPWVSCSLCTHDAHPGAHCRECRCAPWDQA